MMRRSDGKLGAILNALPYSAHHGGLYAALHSALEASHTLPGAPSPEPGEIPREKGPWSDLRRVADTSGAAPGSASSTLKRIEIFRLGQPGPNTAILASRATEMRLRSFSSAKVIHLG